MLRWLRDEGTLSSSQFEGALHHAMRTGCRVEEAVLEISALRQTVRHRVTIGVVGSPSSGKDAAIGAIVKHIEDQV